MESLIIFFFKIWLCVLLKRNGNFLRTQYTTPFLANGVWQMAHKFGKFQLTSQANLAALNIGEIERRFFCQTPCASNFSHSEKRLVKSTPGERIFWKRKGWLDWVGERFTLPKMKKKKKKEELLKKLNCCAFQQESILLKNFSLIFNLIFSSFVPVFWYPQ